MYYYSSSKGYGGQSLVPQPLHVTSVSSGPQVAWAGVARRGVTPPGGRTRRWCSRWRTPTSACPWPCPRSTPSCTPSTRNGWRARTRRRPAPRYGPSTGTWATPPRRTCSGDITRTAVSGAKATSLEGGRHETLREDSSQLFLGSNAALKWTFSSVPFVPLSTGRRCLPTE